MSGKKHPEKRKNGSKKQKRNGSYGYFTQGADTNKSSLLTIRQHLTAPEET